MDKYKKDMRFLGYSFVVILILVAGGCNENGLTPPLNNIQSEVDLKTLPPVGTQLKTADGTLLLNRVIPFSSPMRNPNWDWTQKASVTLYTSCPSGVITTKLPYWINTSFKSFFTLKNGDRDIWPKDGWRLVLRDFGSPQNHIPTPFYILYNKNTGILRYIYFGCTVSDQVNSVVGTLSLKGSVDSPLFTLTGSYSQSISSYGTSKTHTLSKYYHYQWNAMDFRVAGFDPNIDNKYARFIISIKGVKKFSLKGTGSLNINGILGVGGTVHSNSVDFVNSGVRLYKDIAKGYKSINSAQDKFAEIVNFAQKNKDAWWSSILESAASVGATSWLPALGPIVGLVNFIMGGGSSLAPQPRPITLTGNLEIKGTLTGKSPINKLEFIVPGAKVKNPERAARLNELPLYNHKPGVFNLVHTPIVTGKSWADCYSSPYSYSLDKHSRTSPSPLVINYEGPDKDYIVPLRPPPRNRCSTFYGHIKYTVSLDYVKIILSSKIMNS